MKTALITGLSILLAPVPVAAQTLCGADAATLPQTLAGDWFLMATDGEVWSETLRVKASGFAISQVQMDADNGFTMHNLRHPMSAIATTEELFAERSDMARWLDSARAAAPHVQQVKCDSAWPMLKVQGSVDTEYHSEIDIRLIAYSHSCMIGVHSGINAEFNGTAMPSTVYGFVMTKGADGCG